MMNRSLILTAAGTAALAAGLAGAQTHSAYPAYGYDTRPARVVRCESIGSQRNFCRIDTRGGVQIYRQLSRQPCVRSVNWRTSSNGIHVADGCRAEFVVNTRNDSRYQTYDGYRTDRYGRRIYDDRYTQTGYAGDGRTIHCQGSGHGRTYCGLRGNHYTMVDRSPACIVDRTWGDDAYGTWVSGACNADFALRAYPVDERYSRNDPYYDTVEPTYGYTSGYDPGPYVGPMSSTLIRCEPAASGRTYCGDRNRSYSLQFGTEAYCVAGETYGRDSYGTWVAGGCSLVLVPSDYD
jgi:hypothetical protein